MADRLVDLAEALEAVAEAMDAETEILSLSARADFAARAERKVICIEQAASLMERMPKRAPDVSERERLRQAASRLEAASRRNAEALARTLEATRRVVACLSEAARSASTTGTYGPDGRARPSAEAVATIDRSA
jgi:flagellar biosynthesis/type III secretory pathway chaperone